MPLIQNRKRCPFYGFFGPLDQHGNQCPLLPDYSPCKKEYDEIEVDWDECEIKKKLKEGELEELLEGNIFPREFPKGISMHDWYEMIMSNNNLQ